MDPTLVLLLRKSHGWRSLVGCSPWGRYKSDGTERLHFHFHTMEKAMAPHSSTLAWEIPWMEEPGGLQSMGSLRVGHIEQLHFHALEKEMATQSSVLAWRIPGTGEPGGLRSMGSQSRTRLKQLSSSKQHLILLKIGRLESHQAHLSLQNVITTNSLS